METAKTEATKQALATKADAMMKVDTKPHTMKDLIESFKPEFSKALTKAITPERFTRMLVTALNLNPRLAECTSKSFIAAAFTAAQLTMEPNTPLGQAYLIPYQNSRKNAKTGQWEKVLEVQFQLGYKGMLDLAHRSGQFRVIQAHEVHENDQFEYELGLEPKLTHKPALDNRGKVTAYYAMYKLVNGGYGFEVMSIADVQGHREKFSKASSGRSPWDDNFDAMALKTVLKKALKYAPLSVDFVSGIVQDETIRTETSDNMAEVQNEIPFDLGQDEYEEVR